MMSEAYQPWVLINNLGGTIFRSEAITLVEFNISCTYSPFRPENKKALVMTAHMEPSK